MGCSVTVRASRMAMGALAAAMARGGGAEISLESGEEGGGGGGDDMDKEGAGDGPEDEEEKRKWEELLALPPHGSEVFIGGLPRDITEEDLRELCEPLGEVYEVGGCSR